MKLFIRTPIRGDGSRRTPNRPDLGGYGDRDDVRSSLHAPAPIERYRDRPHLTRIAAPEPIVHDILQQSYVEPVSDTVARQTLPHALESTDVRDPELDTFLEDAGLDGPQTHRAPDTVCGEHRLQAEERNAMATIAADRGPRSTCSGHCTPRNPCTNCVSQLLGASDPYDAALDAVRATI